jgi:hypothetical protein
MSWEGDNYLWKIKDLEGEGRGIFEGAIATFAWREWSEFILAGKCQYSTRVLSASLDRYSCTNQVSLNSWNVRYSQCIAFLTILMLKCTGPFGGRFQKISEKYVLLLKYLNIVVFSQYRFTLG